LEDDVYCYVVVDGRVIGDATDFQRAAVLAICLPAVILSIFSILKLLLLGWI
jgi:hypothetical protein